MDPSQPAGRPEPGDGRLAGAREILSSETTLYAYCRAEATDTGHIAPPDRTAPTAATTSSPYTPPAMGEKAPGQRRPRPSLPRRPHHRLRECADTDNPDRPAPRRFD